MPCETICWLIRFVSGPSSSIGVQVTESSNPITGWYLWTTYWSAVTYTGRIRIGRHRRRPRSTSPGEDPVRRSKGVWG
jgi:hypothetical protein